MDKDVKALTEALHSNLELVRLLSQRIESLESQVEENAAQRMSVMLLLRAVVQCSPNRDQVLTMLERMTAQMGVQPGILLDGGKDTLQRMQSHLDWMTGPPRSMG
ncbi:glycerol-3-phosphate responsive antiterminator [Pseudacidovorax sp. 1753]|uniref:hypothetical protein n=1 Tax=Pseudacidovorax sp. 1753 TaxID=3156419 RepID=UPI0033941D41